MLGTYFSFILILFILLIIGTVLAYKGNLKTKIKAPLYKSISLYSDGPDPATQAKQAALQSAWNTVQGEVRWLLLNILY